MKSIATIAGLILLVALPALAQEKSQVSVKSTDVSNGVVIVTVQNGNKSIELQCNQGYNGCTVVRPGTYEMVILPKNWGMYDCANVELYSGDTASPDKQKVGSYCLITK